MQRCVLNGCIYDGGKADCILFVIKKHKDAQLERLCRHAIERLYARYLSLIKPYSTTINLSSKGMCVFSLGSPTGMPKGI